MLAGEIFCRRGGDYESNMEAKLSGQKIQSNQKERGLTHSVIETDWELLAEKEVARDRRSGQAKRTAIEVYQSTPPESRVGRWQ